VGSKPRRPPPSERSERVYWQLVEYGSGLLSHLHSCDTDADLHTNIHANTNVHADLYADYDFHADAHAHIDAYLYTDLDIDAD
jgi:hypothetical protein